VLLSVVLLGEQLAPRAVLGGLLITGAILLVVSGERRDDVARARLLSGVAMATGGVLCLALAIVSVKPILETTDLFLASAMRLLGGALALGLQGALHAPSRRRLAAGLRPQSGWRFALPAAVLGNVVALVLWLAGYKYTTATEASLLNQTTALFIVLLATTFLREPLRWRGAMALALGLGGSLVVLL